MTVQELINELEKCPKDVQVATWSSIITEVDYIPTNKYYVDHRGEWTSVRGPYDNLKEIQLVRLW